MILITGASGFIGNYLIKELQRESDKLFLTTKNNKLVKQNKIYHYLDISNKESFKNIPNKIDTVIHLAGLIPNKNKTHSFKQYMEINVRGTERLLQASAKSHCRRFIYISSQMVVEKPFYLPVDEDHPYVCQSDYSFTKAIAERVCIDFCKSNSIELASLRLSRVFGFGANPGYVLTSFINQAINGKQLIVTGTGKKCRDLIYVKDAVNAIRLAVYSNSSGVFNIGCGYGISIKELAGNILDVFGNKDSSVQFNKTVVENGFDNWMDTTKANKKLHFKAQFSLLNGLKDYNKEMEKA
jgi:UDP-glucose 4-epimerase